MSLNVSLRPRTLGKELGKTEQPIMPLAPALSVPQEWAPSMFTVRVQDEEGRWIIYNSMTGAIGVIPKEKEEAILPLLREGYAGKLEGEARDLAVKGFIVVKGINERRRATLLKHKRQSSRTLRLILMPTEDCNFRCGYCYESFLRGKMLRTVREGIKNLAIKTIPHLADLRVGWFGGEPLEAVEVIEELSHFMLGIARVHNVPYSSSITTNGYNLTPENFKKLLLCGVRQIQVTLDGLPDQHNKLRVLNGGGPTFERIWANLKAVREIQGEFHLLLRINFNPQTLSGLDDLLKLVAQEFGQDRRFSIFFRPIGNWGGPNDGGFDVCDTTSSELGIFESAKKAVNHGIAAALLHSPLAPNGSVCYASNANSFVIGSDGTIYKCTVALDKDINKVGKILPTGEMEIDSDRFALWVTSDDSEDKVCQGCFYRPACQGAACPLIRIETGQRPCPPEKKRIRQNLIAIWHQYQKLGKLDFGGAAINGPMD
ncbi:MAG: radical SAM protein [Elusimicrobiota bacterium]